MNIISLFNLKNSGTKYILVNLISIFIFTILYWLSDRLNLKDVDDPWYYWLYFSGITQTTVGYAGVEIEGVSGVNIMSLKSDFLKICIFLQLLSIIIINGYFITKI